MRILLPFVVFILAAEARLTDITHYEGHVGGNGRWACSKMQLGHNIFYVFTCMNFYCIFLLAGMEMPEANACRQVCNMGLQELLIAKKMQVNQVNA